MEDSKSRSPPCIYVIDVIAPTTPGPRKTSRTPKKWVSLLSKIKLQLEEKRRENEACASAKAEEQSAAVEIDSLVADISADDSLHYSDLMWPSSWEDDSDCQSEKQYTELQTVEPESLANLSDSFDGSSSSFSSVNTWLPASGSDTMLSAEEVFPIVETLPQHDTVMEDKCVTGYSLYSRHVRWTITQSKPHQSSDEVKSSALYAWCQLPKEVKLKWEEKATRKIEVSCPGAEGQINTAHSVSTNPFVWECLFENCGCRFEDLKDSPSPSARDSEADTMMNVTFNEDSFVRSGDSQTPATPEPIITPQSTKKRHQLASDALSQWNEITHATEEQALATVREPCPVVDVSAISSRCPDFVFKCLWDTCDYQFEDQQDLLKHVASRACEHLRPLKNPSAALECQWRGCQRLSNKPFTSLQGLALHIKTVHVTKNPGRFVSAPERSRNFVSRIPTPPKHPTTPSKSGRKNTQHELSSVNREPSNYLPKVVNQALDSIPCIHISESAIDTEEGAVESCEIQNMIGNDVSNSTRGCFGTTKETGPENDILRLEISEFLKIADQMVGRSMADQNLIEARYFEERNKEPVIIDSGIEMAESLNQLETIEHSISNQNLKEASYVRNINNDEHYVTTDSGIEMAELSPNSSENGEGSGIKRTRTFEFENFDKLETNEELEECLTKNQETSVVSEENLVSSFEGCLMKVTDQISKVTNFSVKTSNEDVNSSQNNRFSSKISPKRQSKQNEWNSNARSCNDIHSLCKSSSSSTERRRSQRSKSLEVVRGHLLVEDLEQHKSSNSSKERIDPTSSKVHSPSKGRKNLKSSKNPKLLKEQDLKSSCVKEPPKKSQRLSRKQAGNGANFTDNNSNHSQETNISIPMLENPSRATNSSNNLSAQDDIHVRLEDDSSNIEKDINFSNNKPAKNEDEDSKNIKYKMYLRNAGLSSKVPKIILERISLDDYKRSQKNDRLKKIDITSKSSSSSSAGQMERIEKNSDCVLQSRESKIAADIFQSQKVSEPKLLSHEPLSHQSADENSSEITSQEESSESLCDEAKKLSAGNLSDELSKTGNGERSAPEVSKEPKTAPKTSRVQKRFSTTTRKRSRRNLRSKTVKQSTANSQDELVDNKNVSLHEITAGCSQSQTENKKPKMPRNLKCTENEDNVIMDAEYLAKIIAAKSETEKSKLLSAVISERPVVEIDLTDDQEESNIVNKKVVKRKNKKDNPDPENVGLKERKQRKKPEKFSSLETAEKTDFDESASLVNTPSITVETIFAEKCLFFPCTEAETMCEDRVNGSEGVSIMVKHSNVDKLAPSQSLPQLSSEEITTALETHPILLSLSKFAILYEKAAAGTEGGKLTSSHSVVENVELDLPASSIQLSEKLPKPTRANSEKITSIEENSSLLSNEPEVLCEETVKGPHEDISMNHSIAVSASESNLPTSLTPLVSQKAMIPTQNEEITSTAGNSLLSSNEAETCEETLREPQGDEITTSHSTVDSVIELDSSAPRTLLSSESVIPTRTNNEEISTVEKCSILSVSEAKIPEETVNETQGDIMTASHSTVEHFSESDPSPSSEESTISAPVNNKDITITMENGSLVSICETEMLCKETADKPPREEINAGNSSDNNMEKFDSSPSSAPLGSQKSMKPTHTNNEETNIFETSVVLSFSDTESQFEESLNGFPEDKSTSNDTTDANTGKLDPSDFITLSSENSVLPNETKPGSPSLTMQLSCGESMIDSLYPTTVLNSPEKQKSTPEDLLSKLRSLTVRKFSTSKKDYALNYQIRNLRQLINEKFTQYVSDYEKQLHDSNEMPTNSTVYFDFDSSLDAALRDVHGLKVDRKSCISVPEINTSNYTYDENTNCYILINGSSVVEETESASSHSKNFTQVSNDTSSSEDNRCNASIDENKSPQEIEAEETFRNEVEAVKETDGSSQKLGRKSKDVQKPVKTRLGRRKKEVQLSVLNDEENRRSYCEIKDFSFNGSHRNFESAQVHSTPKVSDVKKRTNSTPKVSDVKKRTKRPRKLNCKQADSSNSNDNNSSQSLVKNNNIVETLENPLTDSIPMCSKEKVPKSCEDDSSNGKDASILEESCSGSSEARSKDFVLESVSKYPHMFEKIPKIILKRVSLDGYKVSQLSNEMENLSIAKSVDEGSHDGNVKKLSVGSMKRQKSAKVPRKPRQVKKRKTLQNLKSTENVNDDVAANIPELQDEVEKQQVLQNFNCTDNNQDEIATNPPEMQGEVVEQNVLQTVNSTDNNEDEIVVNIPEMQGEVENQKTSQHVTSMESLEDDVVVDPEYVTKINTTETEAAPEKKFPSPELLEKSEIVLSQPAECEIIECTALNEKAINRKRGESSSDQENSESRKSLTTVPTNIHLGDGKSSIKAPEYSNVESSSEVARTLKRKRKVLDHLNDQNIPENGKKTKKIKICRPSTGELKISHNSTEALTENCKTVSDERSSELEETPLMENETVLCTQPSIADLSDLFTGNQLNNKAGAKEQNNRFLDDDLKTHSVLKCENVVNSGNNKDSGREVVMPVRKPLDSQVGSGPSFIRYMLEDRRINVLFYEPITASVLNFLLPASGLRLFEVLDEINVDGIPRSKMFKLFNVGDCMVLKVDVVAFSKKKLSKLFSEVREFIASVKSHEFSVKLSYVSVEKQAEVLKTYSVEAKRKQKKLNTKWFVSNDLVNTHLSGPRIDVKILEVEVPFNRTSEKERVNLMTPLPDPHLKTISITLLADLGRYFPQHIVSFDRYVDAEVLADDILSKEYFPTFKYYFKFNQMLSLDEDVKKNLDKTCKKDVLSRFKIVKTLIAKGVVNLQFE